MSPFCRSPAASPAHQPKAISKSTADKGVMTSDLENPLGPYYNGYMFNPWSCPCQRATTAYYGTASATSSPFHTGPRGGGGRGRAASVGRNQMASLQRGGHVGTINRTRAVMKKLPRSVTLDDLDPQQYGDMQHQHTHYMQQPQQQRLHYCPSTQQQQQQHLQSPLCGPPSLRISRRESLGFDPCHSPCQLAHQAPGKFAIRFSTL